MQNFALSGTASQRQFEPLAGLSEQFGGANAIRRGSQSP